MPTFAGVNRGVKKRASRALEAISERGKARAEGNFLACLCCEGGEAVEEKEEERNLLLSLISRSLSSSKDHRFRFLLPFMRAMGGGKRRE